MKLVTYTHQDLSHPGIEYEGKIYNLNTLIEIRNLGKKVESIREFLYLYGSTLTEISNKFNETLRDNIITSIGHVDEIHLLPPVTNPKKVLCIGLNYADHVAETGRKLPEYPDIFAKFATSLIGYKDDIKCSDITNNLDFEGELALVISKDTRNVSEDEAMESIAGLMVLNDITARDLQYRGTQWLAGKALDSSTPCGPTLTTLDEIGDFNNLKISTKVNNVEMQSSNTKHMIFSLTKLVSYISTFMKLEPGDIITTGTPEGIGAKRNPPIWLKPGDKVQVEVENVGILKNTIR